MFHLFVTNQGVQGYSITIYLHKHDTHFLQVIVYNAASTSRSFDDLRKNVRKITTPSNVIPFLNDYGLSLFQCMQTMPWKGRDLFCFNVLETFDPKVPASCQDCDFLMLGNLMPCCNKK
jgi:hypothetical protein